MKKFVPPKRSEEGVEMFNALMERNASQFQMRVLKNRINKLELEEQRAKAKIENAQKRIAHLESFQAQKQRDRELSEKRQNQRIQSILDQNKANSQERDKNRAKIMQVSLNISKPLNLIPIY